jgi:hypothetical protein
VDLAKYLNSWEQKPHVVSRGGQKNFAAFMQDIDLRIRKGWRPDDSYYKDLIAKAILFRSMQRIVRQERFPAYQANIVAYTIAYLSWRSGGRMEFDAIWQGQRLSHGLEDLLKIWSQDVGQGILQSSSGRNVTEWCKRDGCWEYIKNLDLKLPERLPLEIRNIVDEDLEDSQAIEVRRNIKTCMAIGGSTWLRIHGWGTSSGLLDRKQCGIALSLYGLAEGNWAKPPSPRQAWNGVRIIEEAERHGLDVR